MEINELVNSFRNAIERAKANGENRSYFRDFPSGQCGSTSDMLAQFLINNGCGEIMYVNGTYYGDKPDDIQTHAWLEVNGLIIDITADQFKYFKSPLKCNTPVYIGPMKLYHKQFDVSSGGRHRHLGLDSSLMYYLELKECYEIIDRYM